MNKQELIKRLRKAVSGRNGRQSHPWVVTELIQEISALYNERDECKDNLEETRRKS